MNTINELFKIDGKGLVSTDIYNAICKVMPIVSVDVVLFNSMGCVLLLKRQIYPLKGTWCLPGSGIKIGEYPIDTVKRSVREETGIVIQEVHEVCSQTFMFEGKQNISIVHYAFVASKPIVKLDFQHSDSCWFKADNLPKMNEVIRSCILKSELKHREDLGKRW